jgi:hypothetical protein
VSRVGTSIALLLCIAVPAAAEPLPRVEIVLPDCASPPVDPSALDQALRVEVAAAGFQMESGPEATRVTLECVPPSGNPASATLQVAIDFRAARSTASLRTRISLADVPSEERARTAAVAVAELVRATRPGPAPPVVVSRTAPKAAPTPTMSKPAPKPAPRGRLGIGANADVVWLARGQDAFAGGGGHVSLDFPDRWRSWAGVSALLNSVSGQMGPVDLVVLETVLGADWGGPGLALGPEVRVAAIRGRGESVLGLNEAAQWNWFASAGARLSLEVPVVGALSVSTALNVDLVLRRASLYAGSERAVQFVGLQGGASVGLVLHP